MEAATGSEPPAESAGAVSTSAGAAPKAQGEALALHLQPLDLRHPLGLAVAGFLRDAVLRYHNVLNPRLMRVIQQDYHLREYFHALQSYWLMKKGDVMHRYTGIICEKVAEKAEWWHPTLLAEAWQGCVLESSSVVDEQVNVQPVVMDAARAVRLKTSTINCLGGIGFRFLFASPPPS